MKKITVFLTVVLIFCIVFPINSFAAITRMDTIWFEPCEREVVTVSLDVVKTRKCSFGIEFTSAANQKNPTDFTQGGYTGNGMIRLTYDDELVLRANGSWISDTQENDSGLIRVPFARDITHNIKMRFNRGTKTAQWFLDGELIGETSTKNDMPLNAVSVFADDSIKTGFEWSAEIESYETTDSLKNADVLKKYEYKFWNKQGKNNWYFVKLTNRKTDYMTYYAGAWTGSGEYPIIKSVEIIPSDISYGGYMFKSPQKGMARICGEFSMPYADSEVCGGSEFVIYKGVKLISEGSVYYQSPKSFDITVPLEEGEELYFLVKAKQTSINNWVSVKPSVSFLNTDFVPDFEEYTYYEKLNGSNNKLYYNESLGEYSSEAGSVKGNVSHLSLTGGSVIGKSYSVQKDGRYKTFGYFEPSIGEGYITVTFLKNGETVQSQIIPMGERGYVDFGAYAKEGDAIDIEIKASENVSPDIDYSTVTEKYVGTADNTGSTSLGFSSKIEKTESFCDFVSEAESNGTVRRYSICFDKEYPMEYSSDTDLWESTYQNGLSGEQRGYFSDSSAMPGELETVALEITSDKNEILRFEGDFELRKNSDGVVIKLLKNGEVVYSNRVGGERAVRWDEPYDVSCFQNSMCTTVNVNEGDTLTVLISQWRKASNDEVSFKDINVSRVSGDLMSYTTKEKLEKSVVFNTKANTVSVNGISEKAEIVERNGDVLISAEDAVKIFGESDFADGDYVSLSNLSENMGKNIVRTAGKLVIMYDFLPSYIGYSELSEIETVYNSEDKEPEYLSVSVTDENGVKAETFESGKKYTIELNADNYFGDKMNIICTAALYGNDNILKNVENGKQLTVETGTSLNLKNACEFTPSDEIQTVKIFLWDSLEGMTPVLKIPLTLCRK